MFACIKQVHKFESNNAIGLLNIPNIYIYKNIVRRTVILVMVISGMLMRTCRLVRGLPA